MIPGEFSTDGRTITSCCTECERMVSEGALYIDHLHPDLGVWMKVSGSRTAIEVRVRFCIWCGCDLEVVQ